ncbi:MAG: hypothetical protein WBD31_02540 [Rubripirellula sp.]
MKDQTKPVAVIYSIGKDRCAFSGKNSDGAVVSFQDGSIRRQHLSWAMLRKLLQFKEKSEMISTVTEAPASEST